jgi:hypothetical protein
MIQASALKLLAEDADDLKVIAAALQDAVGKIGDISYEPRAHRLTLAFNRYRWEGGGGERVRAAVQVGSVLKVQARKLRRNARDAVVELLSIEFEPGEAPAGDLRAQVECLDVVLADVSAPWATPRVPRHEA